MNALRKSSTPRAYEVQLELFCQRVGINEPFRDRAVVERHTAQRRYTLTLRKVALRTPSPLSLSSLPFTPTCPGKPDVSAGFVLCRAYSRQQRKTDQPGMLHHDRHFHAGLPGCHGLAAVCCNAAITSAGGHSSEGLAILMSLDAARWTHHKPTTALRRASHQTSGLGPSSFRQYAQIWMSAIPTAQG